MACSPAIRTGIGCWSTSRSHFAGAGANLTSGVLFNVYAFVDGEQTLATVYLQKGVQIEGVDVPTVVNIEPKSVEEDGTLDLFGAGTLFDPDFGDLITLSIEVQHGTLDIVSDTGVEVLNGDATASSCCGALPRS